MSAVCMESTIMEETLKALSYNKRKVMVHQMALRYSQKEVSGNIFTKGFNLTLSPCHLHSNQFKN